MSPAVEQLCEEACHQHIYTKVLEAVAKHPRNSFLSEVAIEQLTIMLHYGNTTHHSIVVSLSLL